MCHVSSLRYGMSCVGNFSTLSRKHVHHANQTGKSVKCCRDGMAMQAVRVCHACFELSNIFVALQGACSQWLNDGLINQSLSH